MMKVGDSVTMKVKVTDDMVRKFAELSGDTNPMHLDDAYAAGTRFKRRIAHGMIGGALISRALGTALGPGGIYLAQSLKFMNPIFIDEEVTIHLIVTALRESKGIGTVATTITKENGDMVTKGEALIMDSSHV